MPQNTARGISPTGGIPIPNDWTASLNPDASTNSNYMNFEITSDGISTILPYDPLFYFGITPNTVGGLTSGAYLEVPTQQTVVHTVSYVNPWTSSINWSSALSNANSGVPLYFLIGTNTGDATVIDGVNIMNLSVRIWFDYYVPAF